MTMSGAERKAASYNAYKLSPIVEGRGLSKNVVNVYGSSILGRRLIRLICITCWVRTIFFGQKGEKFKKLRTRCISCSCGGTQFQQGEQKKLIQSGHSAVAFRPAETENSKCRRETAIGGPENLYIITSRLKFWMLKNQNRWHLVWRGGRKRCVYCTDLCGWVLMTWYRPVPADLGLERSAVWN